jgi:hypothetical protein
VEAAVATGARRERQSTAMLGSRAGSVDLTPAGLAREREHAHVVVHQMGFTRGPAAGGKAPVAYGLMLVNDSYDFDAVGVTIRWRVADANARLLAGDAIALTAVPASTTFYVGGQVRIPADAAIGRVSAGVVFRASRKRSIYLPVAADIGLNLRRSGRVRLTGMLTNAYDTRLSADTAIYGVVFDSAGRIIGGAAETVAPAARGLPPGETTGFTIDVPTPAGSPRPFFAGVSIDP